MVIVNESLQSLRIDAVVYGEKSVHQGKANGHQMIREYLGLRGSTERERESAPAWFLSKTVVSSFALPELPI